MGLNTLEFIFGNPKMQFKNWEGVLEQIICRLKTWEGLCRSLSYRGRSLVINNITAARLWQKALALQPPK